MSPAELSAALQDGSQWAADLLATLVACPSVTGEPSSIASLLSPFLEELGFEVDLLPVEPDALTNHPEYSPPSTINGPPVPIVHGRYSGSSEPELLIFAHTDTEPVHDGWTADPYRVRFENGRAIGLGVADDKAGVVSVLAAVRAIRLAGVALKRRPRVILASGKQGGALGTLPGTVVAQGVTGAVYSHPAESGRGLAHLKVASRGVVQIEITVDGVTPTPLEQRTPLSADPRDGRNAAERAVRLTAAVCAVDDGVIRTVTEISAQANAFQVPDTATVTVAHWFGNGDAASVTANLESMLDSFAADDWERVHPPLVRAVGLRANPASCAATPFARWAADLIATTTGHEVENYDWHSASDIRFPMRCLGVPSVGFGASAGQFYGPDEWVDLATMHESTAVLARMLTQ